MAENYKQIYIYIVIGLYINPPNLNVLISAEKTD